MKARSNEEKFSDRMFNLRPTLGNKTSEQVTKSSKIDSEIIEHSEEFPIILQTSDYVSSRALMADPRQHRAEIRISMNSLKLTEEQRMKMIDLVQAHEKDTTKGYHANHMRFSRTPGLSGEVVCRYDPISECLIFQSRYMPTRTQNIDFVVNTLQRLYQATINKYAFEEEIVYDTKYQSVSSKKDIEARKQEKISKYSRFGIDTSSMSNVNDDVVTILNKKDMKDSKLDQVEYSRAAYENYAQEMMKAFNIEEPIKRNVRDERTLFLKNDPIPAKRSQINSIMLGGNRDRYWQLDGNKHMGWNVGNM